MTGQFGQLTVKLVNMKKVEKGLGLPSILFLLFLTLKLTNNIDWSWWWVTSPLWIPFSILFGVFLIAFTIFLIWGIILAFRGKTSDEISERFNKYIKKPQQ